MITKKESYRIIIYCNSGDRFREISEELFKYNFDCVFTSTYQSLLVEIEKQEKYIILADYLLPSFNGLDLLKRIQRLLGSLPPFVFMLENYSQDIPTKLAKLGVNDFICLEDKSPENISRRIQFVVSKLENQNDDSSHLLRSNSFQDFYQLLDNMNDFVIIRDLQEKFIFVNHSCLKSLKYTFEEIKVLKASQLVAPQEIFDYLLESRFLLEKKMHFYETILISKDYLLIPVEINSRVTMFNNQEVVISVVRDISDRKETKEQLKKLNIDLERVNKDYKSQNDRLRNINREVEENRHALKLALQEAENAEKLKNRFLANMSHEIRTPMNAIVGFSQLLEDADDSDVPSFVRIINSNSETLLQLINDLMDIAKIESDLVAITTEKLSLHHLLLDIETIYNYEKKNKDKNHIKIKYNYKLDEDCIIETDKLRLKQVLMNLMSNALKFTAEGIIEFGYKEEGEHVSIYVKDSGIGIPIRMQSQIFERFRQLDEEEKPQGTGIGLSISRSLIRLLGGDVSLNSDTNKGSVFHIKHPIIQNKNSRVKPPTKNMVLIAEDEEDNYHLLKYIVKDLNLDVIWAKDGQEAIDFCSRKPISLILMDIKMPTMGGLEATREILKHKPNIPIIAQTAFTQDEDRQRCEDAGCVEFIPKPINLTTLRRTIAKYV